MVDAGALYAQANRDDPAHRAVIAVLQAEQGPLVTSEAAAQEADYLIGTRLGVDVELAFLQDLAGGTFEATCLNPAERATAAEVAQHYRDFALGLADVTLVVLAQRFATRRILTLNERPFRAVTPLQGDSFIVLPADHEASSNQRRRSPRSP